MTSCLISFINDEGRDEDRTEGEIEDREEATPSDAKGLGTFSSM